MRKFNDPSMQTMYDSLVGMSLERVKKHVLHRGGSIQGAFTDGYENVPLKGIHNYPRNSIAYAAYCAGKDYNKDV